jgi:UDP-N-acetylglucosamine 2-epimerase (non-hydrolysing)
LDGITFAPPFGFFDYIALQQQAYCVLSDSGTISEEAAILGFPAVTLRSAIERPEALDTGSIITSDLRADDVLRAMKAAVSDHGKTSTPIDYGSTSCSTAVRNYILSVAPQHATWAGLR